MDELIDVLDDNGNPTGETIMKFEAHKNGVFHPTVHIWFYTKTGKVLIQQRGKDKDTFPLLWDVSVAGHIGAGEGVLDSAIREVEEEIGITISENDLQKVGLFKSVQKHHETLIDCEYHHTFLCELKIPLNGLKKQDSEVEALDLIPLTKFAEETWGLANISKYVPHGPAYYKTIIKAIKEKL
ncbi:isopentenyldiphosphate isomerase [Saonia flava]|uniref:Isopentenyldiphosphate isomerase n=1 Tax=Saonia flava TaxID=523696 RepID=A0A846QSM8_9FLAO|nr:NUDIX domain-containing protein [Saonia flava]NJB71976.1 isopentenyldiphosphate isomerase [Saonia flava]